MKDRIRRLFCRHEWTKAAVYQETDPVHNIRYPVRKYRCTKCGRASAQDGRHDRLAEKAV